MTQNIVVALIVAFAAFYATWRWMPAGWRRSAAQKLASITRRAGLVDQARADQLAASLAKSSGCGACDTCGACGKADMKQPSAAQSADLQRPPAH